MAVTITKRLRSVPSTIGAGSQAELVLGMTSSMAAGEAVTITFTIRAPGWVFASTNAPVLTTTAHAAFTGTTVGTRYALVGGEPGGVGIEAEVQPSDPPARSSTMAVVSPSPARASRRTTASRKTAVKRARAGRTAAAKRKRATPRAAPASKRPSRRRRPPRNKRR